MHAGRIFGLDFALSQAAKYDKAAELDELLDLEHIKGRLAERLDVDPSIPLNPVTGGHRVVVGTPQQIADDLLAWIDEAADGFNFNSDRFIDGLEHFESSSERHSARLVARERLWLFGRPL